MKTRRLTTLCLQTLSLNRLSANMYLRPQRPRMMLRSAINHDSVTQGFGLAGGFDSNIFLIILPSTLGQMAIDVTTITGIHVQNGSLFGLKFLMLIIFAEVEAASLPKEVNCVTTIF